MSAVEIGEYITLLDEPKKQQAIDTLNELFDLAKIWETDPATYAAGIAAMEGRFRV